MNDFIEPIDISDSVNNALTNLSDEPTKNMGKTFGDLWYLVFGSISFAASKKRMKYSADLEKYRQELTTSIKLIPPDEQIEPSIQVTAQALENSKYCVSSKILRQMFVKLISGTMNKTTEPLVHPAFPEILKQLSESDALLLKEISQAIQPYLPIANIGIHTGETSRYILSKNVFVPESLAMPPNICALSLSSLERANLISIRYDQRINDDTVYDPIKQTREYLKAKNIDSELNNTEPIFDKGMIELTALGKAFSTVCIS